MLLTLVRKEAKALRNAIGAEDDDNEKGGTESSWRDGRNEAVNFT